MTPRSFYRSFAIAESITWTLLIAGMVLKYAVGVGSWPVSIAGFLHGTVFIGYALTAVLVGVNQRWPKRLMAFGVATAVIPYATIPFDLWLERHGRLDGGWRKAATEHPSDNLWPNVVLRALLNRPVLLGATFAILLAAIMSTLLVVGPPGGRS
jgi:integral membrane protein